MEEQVAARIIVKIIQLYLYKRGLSSVGRAPALQAGGREFESLSLHCRRNAAGGTLKTEYRNETSI